MITLITALFTQSDEISRTDPTGVFVALMSIAVVFSALVILYFAYSLISMIVKRTERAQQSQTVIEHDDEIAAAIGMALTKHLNEDIHDMESYKITIRRKDI